MKPRSGASPRIRVVRLRDGEGEARRKAVLMECRESISFLLLLLKGGQGAGTSWRACCSEELAEGKVCGEGAAAVQETSGPRGLVFGVPGGHRPWKSKEWTTLSSTSLVLWVHCVRRKVKERSVKRRKWEFVLRKAKQLNQDKRKVFCKCH